MKSVLTLLLPGLLTLVGTLAAAPLTYTYTPIAEPNGAGSNTSVAGLNNAGQVVGSYYDSSTRQTTGFLYTNGAYTSITVPGATSTQALGINNLGQIVGVYQDSTNTARLFLDNNGAFTTINPPGGLGQSFGFGGFQAGINDQGQIVSSTIASRSFVGFIYSQGQFSYIPPNPVEAMSPAYSPTGINNSGQVAVTRVYVGSETAYLFANGTLTPLQTTNGQVVSGYTTGINNAGDVVGIYPSSIGLPDIPTSFLYSNGTLTTFPQTTSPNLYYLQGINDAGQLIGTGVNGAVLATPNTAATPEPSSLLLLGSGLSGLVFFARSKRRAATKASV